jgi:uncharacterized membrane protein YhdT
MRHGRYSKAFKEARWAMREKLAALREKTRGINR